MGLVSSICECLVCLCVCPYVYGERERKWGSGKSQGKGQGVVQVWECVCGPKTCQHNTKTTNKRNEIELGAKLSFHAYVFDIFGTGCHNMLCANLKNIYIYIFFFSVTG